jgi:hypothetical protein
MLWALAVAAANPQVPMHWKLTCSTAAHGSERPLAHTRYGGEQPFGFDLAASPRIEDGACTSDRAFFVSAAEPDGDYRVTVTLGNPQASATTTVKAEARRLMLEDVSTAAGKKIRQSFVVHVRTPEVNDNEKVRLKPREIGNLEWDGKLTLEFVGEHPSVESIEIAPVHVPTVYLAGDSTVVDQDKEPWAAWGQMLPVFFNDRVAIANEAESGETIASFVGEHRFDKIFSTIRPGDYLLMQFAHNDQKPGRGFVSIPQQGTAAPLHRAGARARRPPHAGHLDEPPQLHTGRQNRRDARRLSGRHARSRALRQGSADRSERNEQNAVRGDGPRRDPQGLRALSGEHLPGPDRATG